MIRIIVGLLIVVGSIGLLWVMLPTNGKLSRLATTPILESILPLVIVSGFAVGLALIFSFAA